jgi:hypothetical protein
LLSLGIALGFKALERLMGLLFFALKPLFVGNILRLYVFAGFFPLSLEREDFPANG